MANFSPFIPFPRHSYYHYYNSYPNSHYPQKNNIEDTEHFKNTKIEEYKNTVKTVKKSSRYNPLGSIKFSNIFSNDLENPIVEILGIELYLDDLIILGLLFFLYQENVQDEILFFILILLLLS